MQIFQDTLETRKQSFISAFSICMTVPPDCNINSTRYKFDAQIGLVLNNDDVIMNSERKFNESFSIIQ